MVSKTGRLFFKLKNPAVADDNELSDPFPGMGSGIPAHK